MPNWPFDQVTSGRHGALWNEVVDSYFNGLKECELETFKLSRAMCALRERIGTRVRSGRCFRRVRTRTQMGMWPGEGHPFRFRRLRYGAFTHVPEDRGRITLHRRLRLGVRR